MTIRVVLADDHTVVRDGIRSIIERIGKGIEVVGEAENGLELLAVARKIPADVYVVDISMPGLSGIEASARLLKMRPGSKIVLLTMYSEGVLIDRAFQEGVHGYVLKDSSPQDIIRAIRDVHSGHYYLSPELSGYIIKKMVDESSADGGVHYRNSLTLREREVLQLLCDGKTEKEIAQKLDIATNTVHVHKKNIMHKLDIHTTAGLIRYAITKGIIQL
jgi:DNA-binding NarL/FixJ family response regulator